MPQEPRIDLIQGSLDIMVLKTLSSMGSQHGYGIARRIEQVAEGMLSLNQGTIYASLVRLQQRGWIRSEWGLSENNRRAKFYSITPAGQRHLTVQAGRWTRISQIITRFFEPFPGKTKGAPS